MSVHQLTLKTVLPSAPATQRATPVRIDAFRDSLAYGSGNCVIVRQLGPDVPANEAVRICTLHKAPVTAVRFSPNGAFVASGDKNGTVIIFANKAGTLEKFSSPVLQGAVRDIAWSGDGERLVVVGEGKTLFGAAISNTGNAIGAINGHTRAILSCDMRHDRPFRAFTGGADSLVGYYEGVPFVFTRNNGGHGGSVNCLRYCAAVNEVAACSSAADIIVYDGTTGEEKRRVNSGHTGTVYSLSWSPDGKSIATASADKHVHIIDAGGGAGAKFKVNLGAAIMDMQQGVVWTASCGIVSVSLGGTLTTISAETGKVASTQAGHQGRVLFLHVCSESGDLLSLSADGRLIRWHGATNWSRNSLVPLPGSADVASCATVSGTSLYLVAGHSVLSYNTQDASAPVRVLSQSAGGFALAIVATLGGKLVLVSRNKLVVLDNAGSPCDSISLPPQFNAASAAAVPGTEEWIVVGGNCVAAVYKLSPTGSITATGVALTNRHTGSVSSLATSHDGTKVSSADGTSRSIVVWSPANGEVLVHAPMCNHTAAVTSMAFHKTDANKLLSGALDCTVIAWDLCATDKRKMEDATHRGGVSAVGWGRAADKDLVSAGGDCCIKRWAL